MILRAITSWRSWVAKRRLEKAKARTMRAYPELAEIERARAKVRDAHRKGVTDLDRRARSIIYQALGRG